MNQQEYKYIAYCNYYGEHHTFVGDSIEQLQDEIDSWHERTQGYTPYETQLIDSTICISDFQFLIYTRNQNGKS